MAVESLAAGQAGQLAEYHECEMGEPQVQMGPNGADFLKLPPLDLEEAASGGAPPGKRLGTKCSFATPSTMAATLSLGASQSVTASPSVSAAPSMAQTRSKAELENGRTNDILLAKISAFDDQREEEKRRMLHSVVRIFLVLVALGAVGTAASFFCPTEIYEVLYNAGYALVVFGLVCASSCPLNLLDFNELAKRNPISTLIGGLGCMAIAAFHVPYFPYLGLLEVLITFFVSISGFASRLRRLPSWWPRSTTLLAFFGIVDNLVWGCAFILYDWNESLLTVDETFSPPLGYFHLLMFVVLLVLWLWRRWHPTQNGSQHRNLLATYEVFYAWCLVLSASLVTMGISRITLPRPGHPEDFVGGVALIGRAFFISIVTLLLVVIGRNRLFNILGRSFDRDSKRLCRDGAFIAELLDAIPVQEGQLWWVHREAEDERYDDDDPRRKFQQGVVTEVISASNFLVQLPPQEVPDSSATEAAGTRWPLSGLLAQTFAGGPVTPIQLPSTSESTSKEELLRKARQGLRCVDAWNLSQELMRRVNARNNPELQAQWYALSREVRPGEDIDFFLSNSWYDDAELKWQKLSEVIDKFHRRHGRFPTFWLDKVCIDQTSITDGLKVLPVNVMACRKLLVMCGHTYLSRLWCIWELFTLFAFASEEAALDRVEFVFLGDYDEGMEMLDNMVNFHVKNSHCYDPNEEARLRQVIDAVGTAPFNKRIADMAHITRLRLEQQQDGFRSASLSWASKSWCDAPSSRRTLANLAAAEEAAIDLSNL